eukprot:12591923-Ditylum_brightwellii.AAC.1
MSAARKTMLLMEIPAAALLMNSIQSCRSALVWSWMGRRSFLIACMYDLMRLRKCRLSGMMWPMWFRRPTRLSSVLWEAKP